MNNKLKAAVKKELHCGLEYLKAEKIKKAFYHLERAHILGQESPYYHTASHLYMLYAATVSYTHLTLPTTPYV